ncbi:MAG: CapA family protein [Candidatus Coatesbacteria bacterium]|nr:CapA family protein [Candidatus Coatesbacteria bacterium]
MRQVEQLTSLLLLCSIACFVLGLTGSNSKEGKPITVIFGGDVALVQEVEKRIDEYGEDYVFGGIRDLLQKADVTAINLEAPLTLSNKKTPKPTPPGLKEPVYLKARPASGKTLSHAGFDVVFLANNHIADYEDSVLDTVKAVRALGIKPVGAGENRDAAYRPLVLEVRGVKMAFLAFCDVYPTSFEAGERRPGCAWAHVERIESVVREAKSQADLVFVNLHFGGQDSTVPSSRQKLLAKTALDAGADMVVGNHPHVLQPIAVSEGKPVLFSIGNLVYPMPIYSWSIGILARATIVDRKVQRVELIPVQTIDLTKPLAIPGHHVLDYLYRISKEFGDLPSIKDGFIKCGDYSAEH